VVARTHLKIQQRHFPLTLTLSPLGERERKLSPLGERERKLPLQLAVEGWGEGIKRF